MYDDSSLDPRRWSPAGVEKWMETYGKAHGTWRRLQSWFRSGNGRAFSRLTATNVGDVIGDSRLGRRVFHAWHKMLGGENSGCSLRLAMVATPC